MTIEEALKSNDATDIRLSNGDSWMYWDSSTSEWVTMTNTFAAVKCKELYRGVIKERALDRLIYG